MQFGKITVNEKHTMVARNFKLKLCKKLSYRWQTARRICANAMIWLT